MDIAEIKNLLLKGDPAFWAQLKSLTQRARDFEELFLLSSLRRKAHARNLSPAAPPPEKLRLAILGGYSLYGVVHAIGVVANHYYTVFLKKRLGRDKFKAYNENQWIRAAAVAGTFCYCGGSLIFFANTFPQLQEIFSLLQ